MTLSRSLLRLIYRSFYNECGRMDETDGCLQQDIALAMQDATSGLAIKSLQQTVQACRSFYTKSMAISATLCVSVTSRLL